MPDAPGTRMVTSAEDARLLFARWQEESSAIHIRLASSRLVFQATGGVNAFTADTLEMSGDSWTFTIPLHDASYAFSDPREIPRESVRRLEASRYELGLLLRLPNGDQLALLELRKAGEGEPPEE
jgi:hypothetical protein